MDIAKEIKTAGASLWLDSLSRELLDSGALAGLKENLGVTGVTSNPSIFEAAMTRGKAYAGPMRGLLAQGRTAQDVFETLALEDIRRAADLFKDVYEATGGADGFVSMEVNPALAYEQEATVREGERLFAALGRANAMIKVPSTVQGVRAGNALLRKGVNVNFTLIFSPERYTEVVQAYVDALAWRLENKLPVDSPASVASFFVSRIDTAVDNEIEMQLAAEDAFETEALYDLALSLRGRAGIANSLVAYKIYSLIFASRDFQPLQEKGAHRQRILWASTGVKNPAYKDTLYTDALLLPGSVNTLPEAALKAFADHGAPDKTPLKARLAGASAYFAELGLAGVDFPAILQELEKDGVEKFSRSNDALLAFIEGRKKAAGK